jgi:hypothetical protein
MVEIGLVERRSLPGVDRAGVGVAELVESRRVEIDRLAVAAVERDGKGWVPSIATMVPVTPLSMPSCLSVPVKRIRSPDEKSNRPCAVEGSRCE